MLQTILCLAVLFACPAIAWTQTLTVTWNASLPGTDASGAPDPISGYIVYLGTQSLVYDVAVDAHNVLTFTLPWPADRAVYTAVLAYSAAGMRSDLSLEASWLPPPPPPVTCTFTLIGPTGSFGNGGGVGEVQITASQSECPWTATTSQTWVGVLPTSGTGAQSVQLLVAPNPIPDARSATVIIGGASVTIQQEPAAPPPPPSDTTPPTVALRVIRSGNSSNFTATTTSPSPDAVRADVYVDGVRVATACETCSITFVSPYQVKVSIRARGSHVVLVEVRDRAGNVGTAVVTVTR